MKKSFKRSIAVLLSVIMAATTMPFSALAAAGEYKPDIQLQFGTFWNASAGSPLNQENQYDYDYSLSGIYGPVVDYKNGALTLDADKYAAWNASYDMDAIDESYTLQEGDIFTITARLDNVNKISAFEAAISYSDNIAPLVDDDWDVDGTTPFLNDSIYDGLNTGLLGNLSYVDAEKNVMIVSAAAEGDYADVSETAVTGLTNPATGETDYNFAGKAVIATFVFQVVDAGPITFGIYNGADDEDTTYGGAYYIADVNDGTDPEDYTTYEPADAIGETDMTFMTKNEYVQPSGYTITFIDAKGDTISSATYEDGADVTIPELPKMTNTTTQHTTYAWDVEPSATATADATYTIVATTADHDYTSKVAVQPTCDKKGKTTYTCKVCEYNFTVEDIAATGKHTAAAAVKENVVEATCAKAGSYDSVVYCSACGTEMSRTTVNVDKLSHTYSWTYDDSQLYYNKAADRHDGELVGTCASCGDVKREAATDTSMLRISGYALVLDSSLTITFNMKKTNVTAFKDIVVKAKTAFNGTLTYETPDKTDSTNYSYLVPVIPQYVKDNVEVVAYSTCKASDGQSVDVWGPVYTKSVLDYANQVLGSSAYVGSSASAKNKALATVAVNILNYAAAAQSYSNYATNDLANANLTATQKALATPDIESFVDSKNYAAVPVDNQTARFCNAALALEDAVVPRMSFALKTNIKLEDIQIKTKIAGNTVVYNPIDNPELFQLYSSNQSNAILGTENRYYFFFRGAAANQMSEVIEFQILDKDGTAISPVCTYSIESYAASVFASTGNTSLKNLVMSIMKYGKSAYTYGITK